MTLLANLQDLTGATSGLMNPTLDRFKATMDGMLSDGRDFTIDLPPQKTLCPANCKYNPAYDKTVGINGALCQTCKGQGYIFEHRQTTYKCNRRWTNVPLDSPSNGGEGTTAGMVFGNFVRIKTVIQSFNHIQESVGGTIDGLKVKLYQEPRKTGWANEELYVISWWERTNKKENG